MMASAILKCGFAAGALIAGLITLPCPALACSGPYDATTFLLPSLPPLEDGEIALETEILSEEHVLPIEARVIRVLGGTYSSDRVRMVRFSCDVTRIFKGMRLSVAGRICIMSGEPWFVPFEKRLQPRGSEELDRGYCPGRRPR